MNQEKHQEDDLNNTLKAYWNQCFQSIKPEAIKQSDMTISNPLDQALKDLGDEAENILDLGTGAGYCLFTAYLLGDRVKTGLGIDPSKNAIDFAIKTCELSGFAGLSFVHGEQSYLMTLASTSFDGIICSNVLDVIPKATSDQLINAMDRLLKPGGIMVLKFNFYLTEELIKKLAMEEIASDTYQMKGVLRAVNLTTDEWIKKFPGYDVIRTEQYERIPNGPKDRIVMLRKLSIR